MISGVNYNINQINQCKLLKITYVARLIFFITIIQHKMSFLMQEQSSQSKIVLTNQLQ